MGCFCPKQKRYDLRIYRGWLWLWSYGVMTMKNNAKFEEELTFHFKVDLSNLTNFDSSTRKLKKLLFNSLFNYPRKLSS